jgi:hypothetical protein
MEPFLDLQDTPVFQQTVRGGCSGQRTVDCAR